MIHRFGRVIALVAIAIWSLTMGVAANATPDDGTGAATPQAAAPGLAGAVAWLQAQQADDGGFVGFSGASDAGTTVDAITALAAAGQAGIDTGDTLDKALAYLASGDVALVYTQTGVGQSAKLVLALTAAGVDPDGFAHVDPITIVENGLAVETGLYGTGVFDHALAVLALVETGNEVPDIALDAFATTQSEGGGWAFDASTDPSMADSNTTAISIQALVAAGEGESDLVTHGLAYLDSIWIDGGAAYSTMPDTLADANSTAIVIQGMIATGSDVTSQLELLATFQNESGGFFYNAADTTDNLFATLQAIPALAGVALPIQGTDLATPVAAVNHPIFLVTHHAFRAA